MQQPMEMEGRPAHSTINHGPISTLRLDRIWVSLGIKGAANQWSLTREGGKKTAATESAQANLIQLI